MILTNIIIKTNKPQPIATGIIHRSYTSGLWVSCNADEKKIKQKVKYA